MINIVLISHGTFCEGLLDGLKMIAGSDYGAKAVPLFPGTSPETYREELKKVLDNNNQKEDKRTIILADIIGGTPYQSALYFKNDYEIGIISGMNMPMLLTIALEQDEISTVDEIINKQLSLEACGISGMNLKRGERKNREKLSINKN